MKSIFKPVLCWGVCLVTGTTLAQAPDYSGTSRSSDTTGATTRETGQSQKFCRVRDLDGARVNDAQGNKIGDVKDILINPQQGETFAAIDVSGGRYAVVPIQALTVSKPGGMVRHAQVTLNATKEELQSGPTLAKNEWQNLDDPSFTQKVYSHYKLQPPSGAMGGTSATGMSGAATGLGSGQTTNSAQPEPSQPK